MNSEIKLKLLAVSTALIYIEDMDEKIREGLSLILHDCIAALDTEDDKND